ncbi:hypothetical protein ACJIZ3_024855 [Penstemon smallii]|uniref:RING-type domain-containing protein n=1 Tax=Penstemon smallii TaxID=265156 RepID=A0ABD3TT11_9LAMI
MSMSQLEGMTPTEIAEHLKLMFPEFGDLDAEEVLLRQASVLSYLENNPQYSGVTSEFSETSSRSKLAHESESLYGESNESQLALDEAIARSLQELGDDFETFNISEHSGSALENTAPTSRETTSREIPTPAPTSTRVESQPVRQDNIDPDNMTYEELQSLGESVGSESKGLPAELRSRLPSFKYKNGSSFFRRKKKEKEECVICCSEFKNGAALTALPCTHQYHSDCINHWLEMNKHCPVCQKEVQDE